MACETCLCCDSKGTTLNRSSYPQLRVIFWILHILCAKKLRIQQGDLPPVHGHDRILPVTSRCFRAYERLRENAVSRYIVLTIRLIGAQHSKPDLFTCERLITDSQDSLAVQNLHGVRARNDGWIGLELV